ncbi:acyltransferase domain-containing protein [Thermocatellispora tengchongensis]|uniref:acyltransferase domain-containing protein n=1 Tax=Thermocatellispora tengchongensis TaxID=1073253 RepID=UPI003639ADE5
MDVAIVGMACVYPDAPGVQALWESVLWRRRALLPRPGGPRGARTALIEGWSPSGTKPPIPVLDDDAAGGDPLRALAVDTAHRALADLSEPCDWLDPARISVVIGNLPFTPKPGGGDVLDRLGLGVDRAGPLGDDPRGSSLLCLITACRTLRDGGADLALAGGVELGTGALAPLFGGPADGRVDGFWPGQGCGVVALMRAADARARGLRVYAEIAGWGVSAERAPGPGGPALPEVDGRLLALRRAYAHSGVRPQDVRLFEGHATTTPYGTAGLAALARLLRRPPAEPTAGDGRPGDQQSGDQRPGDQPLDTRAYGGAWAAVGAIGGNIGHSGAAAGVAGVIKAALAVAHGVLPPACGADEPPHPLVTAPEGPLRALAGPRPWPDGEPRHAGVSAMGHGGVHAHLVLREPGATVRAGEPGAVERGGEPVIVPRTRDSAAAPPRPRDGGTVPRAYAHTPWPSPADPVVFPISGSPGDVRTMLERIADQATCWHEAELLDLARALAHQTPRGPLRVALVAGSAELLAERARLGLELAADPPPGRLVTRRGVRAGLGVRGRVTLLFPGQTAPLRRPEDVAWRRREEPVWDTAVAQPAALEAALVALRELDALGLNAGAAIGHGVGEVAGLVWAGCLTSQDARRLVRRRGRLMSDAGTPGTGMLSVTASREEVERLVTGTGLVVAAVDGPRAHVLSGRTAELMLAAKRAEAEGLETVRLPATRALHSPYVAACQQGFAECLQGVTFLPAQRR